VAVAGAANPYHAACTRSVSVGRSPAVTGKTRCRMHGGAVGSGGPKGARNGNYKHGRYTAEAIALSEVAEAVHA
jgi:glucans biosynthesis protein